MNEPMLTSEMVWQPIETAPRDGAIFLFFNARNGWVNTGFWSGTRFFWHHLGPSGARDPIDPMPTHWMPLPEPPKS